MSFMNFTEDFYSYLATHTLIGVKGGKERDSFLNIWMVSVGDRVFARSWNKSANSWFTEFTRTGEGEIKYGEKVLSVKAKKLAKEAAIQKLIDKAYREKYKQSENLKYAEGISQPEYHEYTMEFFPLEE